jgi:anti-sigma factor RsiW
MNCHELVNHLLDYIGGELILEQRQTIELHLACCERCTALVHSYTCTIQIARALPLSTRTLPPGVEARLRRSLEAELAKHSQPPQLPQAPT